MPITLKSAAKAVLPPILVAALRPRPKPEPPKAQPFEFSEPYATWAEAAAAAEGYDAPHILAKVRTAALKAKSGEIAYEQDSVEHLDPSYRWEMLACLTSALSQSPGRPGHVVDFGGSLASMYYRHRPFLGDARWSVVEQPSFVAVGRADFEDDEVSFHDTLAEALGRAPADLLLCGSVLQVIEDPFGLVRDAAAARIPFLLIDRTPVYDVPEDRIVVLKVKAAVYEGSYPYRQFCAETFVERLSEAGYELVARYERESRPGFFCRLKAR